MEAVLSSCRLLRRRRLRSPPSSSSPEELQVRHFHHQMKAALDAIILTRLKVTVTNDQRYPPFGLTDPSCRRHRSLRVVFAVSVAACVCVARRPGEATRDPLGLHCLLQWNTVQSRHNLSANNAYANSCVTNGNLASRELSSKPKRTPSNDLCIRIFAYRRHRFRLRCGCCTGVACVGCWSAGCCKVCAGAACPLRLCSPYLLLLPDLFRLDLQHTAW